MAAVAVTARIFALSPPPPFLPPLRFPFLPPYAIPSSSLLHHRFYPSKHKIPTSVPPSSLDQHPSPRFFNRREFGIKSLILSSLFGTLVYSLLKFIGQSSTRSVRTLAMEGNASSTVTSIVVYVTVPNREAGKKLAEGIIKEKLAACVNIVPGIESIYFWDGKVQNDSEELLIIKTRESLLEALTEHVKANHEYEVPEVISLPITGGNHKYLEWIKSNTRDQ